MSFTPYQKCVVAVLAFLQFTIVLDFMILSPLGAFLLRDLGIGTARFGFVVSAYVFSAGVSGFLTAGFADKFDRKKLLLLFYSGFIVGTFLCGIAPDYGFLLMARIVTGLFGGVIGAIGMAIVADLFPFEMRGRVMGIIQSAYAASQVLGIPAGLYLSNLWGWHAPFLLIAALGAAVGVVIAWKLKPIADHIKVKREGNPFRHLLAAVTRSDYLRGYAATVFLATGGFLLAPFASAFTVGNLGIPIDQLPVVYMVPGICTIFTGPLIGRLSDSLGKYRVFFGVSLLAAVTALIYCNLGVTPLWAVILVNVLLYIGVTGRIVTASALTSAVPDMPDRGAYMSVNASIQQVSGGIAAGIAGLIVSQRPDGSLERFDALGWVVVGAMAVTLVIMYSIHRMVADKVSQPLGSPKGGAGP